MKGITRIFDDRKWVFTYVLTGLCVFHFDKGQGAQILSVAIPFVIGANAFEKSQWRKSGE